MQWTKGIECLISQTTYQSNTFFVLSIFNLYKAYYYNPISFALFG